MSESTDNLIAVLNGIEWQSEQVKDPNALKIKCACETGEFVCIADYEGSSFDLRIVENKLLFDYDVSPGTDYDLSFYDEPLVVKFCPFCGKNLTA